MWKAVVLLLCIGCGEQPPGAIVTGDTPPASQADTVLFRVAVQKMDSLAPYPLRVDPRPLRAGFRATEELRREQLLQGMSDAIRARSSVLERLRIPEADILADNECAFVRGYPPPPEYDLPDPASRMPPRCRSIPDFSSVAFSLPQSTCAESLPARGGHGSAAGNCQVLHVVEVTPDSFLTYELRAERTPDGPG